MEVALNVPGSLVGSRSHEEGGPSELTDTCHVLEHEDHEMMRPYYVGKIPAGR